MMVRKRSSALPLASTADIRGMALSPDDLHIILGTGTATSDIWLLEQLGRRRVRGRGRAGCIDDAACGRAG